MATVPNLNRDYTALGRAFDTVAAPAVEAGASGLFANDLQFDGLFHASRADREYVRAHEDLTDVRQTGDGLISRHLDYPYPELGYPTNAELIARVVDLAHAMGREVATATEAREILGMPK